jgi:enterochelin esterase-like enzyme
VSLARQALPFLFAGALLCACAHVAPPRTVSAEDIARRSTTDTLQVEAPGVAPAPLRVRVLLPPHYDAKAAIGYPVLYVNDGQDMEAVDLQATLASLYAQGTIRPAIIVAIDMPPDRMGAYGLSDRAQSRSVVAQTKYGPVGMHAHAYSEWLVKTLVPMIDARYRTRTAPDGRTVLGWSLGALNAFNLGWQYPEVFARAGAFSPSFWLAGERGDAAATQRTRLAQRMVDGTTPRNGARFYFAVGTAEEADDRDNDGINDALDDTSDLIDGWRAGDEVKAKGLRQLGYSVSLDHATRPARANAVLAVLEGGQHNQASWAKMLPGFLRWAYAVHAPPIAATGTVESYQDFPSARVAARNIDVWLPPGYAAHPRRRYPVLYMHDGQNLFDPALSYIGVDWGVDEAMTKLIAEGRAREAIVVGIWNTPLRLQEYMPRKPVAGDSLPIGVEGMGDLPAASIVSDRYLDFIVHELKPFIDATYRTHAGRKDTFVMGSSMGGLISLYAAAEHPDVFGGVGAVSTHWPIGNGVVIDWLATHLPDPRTHRLYFDHGTATLDAQYAPFQPRVDAMVRANGYVDGRTLDTRVFEGAEHSERAWRQRVQVPLEFLLGK